MLRKKKWTSRDIPPCPDPQLYSLVIGENGPFWRLRKGILRPVHLNDSFTTNSSLSRITGPAGKQVKDRLRPYFEGMHVGRIHLTIANLLSKALKQKGRLDYTFFKGLEFSKYHSTSSLFASIYHLKQENGSLNISIPIQRYTLSVLGPMVTHYFFELVLITGDPGIENNVRVTSTESPLYPYEFEGTDTCTLSLLLPEGDTPWFASLKINSLNDNEMAMNTKYYRMKVVEVG